MRFTLLVTIILLSISSGYTQNSKSSNWKISNNFSIDDRSSTEFIPLPDATAEIPGILISSEYNYTIGLNVEKKFSNKLSFTSGLRYANRDFSSALICFVCDVVPITLKQRFIQVPIGIKYYLVDGKFRPFSKISSIQSIATSNERIQNSFQYSGELMLGFDLIIFKGLFLNVTAGLQRNFTSDLNYRIYNLGIGYSL